MDPITLGALAMGAGSLIGAIANAYGSSKAQDILDEAKARYGSLDPDAVFKIASEKLGPSAMEKIQTDARLKDAQYAALQKMKGIVDGGGMDPQEQADLARVQGEAARADSANRAGILESMQRRGVSGSGAELAAQLQSAQGAADRTYQGGLDATAQARQRYFQALQGMAGLAGGIRGQEFGEQSDIARAKDERDRLNWGAQRDAAQQRFNNQKAVADAQTAIDMQTAAGYQRAGAQTAQAAHDTGSAVATGFGAYDDPNDPKKKDGY